MEDAARDGNELIVHRGGDISRACLCCGKSAEVKITCHLRRKKSGIFHKGVHNTSSLMLILDVLEFVLFFFMFLADLPTSRKRKLTYGLCGEHLIKRRLMLIGWPIVFAAAIALLVYMFGHTSAPMYVAAPCTFFGLMFLVGGPFLYFMAPGPSLSGENKEFLWIKGGGKEFLNGYPEQAQLRAKRAASATTTPDHGRKPPGSG